MKNAIRTEHDVPWGKIIESLAELLTFVCCHTLFRLGLEWIHRSVLRSRKRGGGKRDGEEK
jgi:hypothetical protein